MEQVILNDKQKIILDTVAKEERLSDFYLTGGTALAAYYFQHRFSEDLDFFTFNDPDIIFLHSFTEKLKTAIGTDSMRFERLYDRNQFFFRTDQDELKIEFTKYPFNQLESTTTQDGIKIDSLRDIAANKLMAILDRFDPKDFVDLFYILQKFELKNVRQDVEQKFGITVGNIFLGSELAKVRRIEALPKMLKPLTINELKDLFSKEAQELKNKIIELGP